MEVSKDGNSALEASAYFSPVKASSGRYVALFQEKSL
jgi:hypothetical protein